jgi:hypothetical protein
VSLCLGSEGVIGVFSCGRSTRGISTTGVVNARACSFDIVTLQGYLTYKKRTSLRPYRR